MIGTLPKTLRHQLVLMNAAATGVAVLVAIMLLFTVELQIWKKAFVRDIGIKADIIGNQCTAALIFDVPADAEEVLAALREDPRIEHAVVYTKKGQAFALYRSRRADPAATPSVPPPDGHRFGSNHLELTRPILLHEDQLGTISIRARLDDIRAALAQYAAVSLTALLLALAVASVLLARFQHAVTGPVTDLANLMEGVSRDKDYARRAGGQGPDELASLARSFNEMLAAIQDRDHDLARSLAELQNANRKLKDLDRLKSDFISTVSHELRTPITSVKAFVELILIKPNMPEPRKRALLEIVNDESDRLSRLIGDLLDLSRIESGSMRWRDEEVALREVIETAISGIVPLAQKKGLTIERSDESDLPALRVDRDRVLQVVTNLLSNAVKFTPPGGRIAVLTRRTGPPDAIEVSVTDSGPGIPAEELPRIFEKFHRAGDVLTNSVEGTGLGLAISRQIVEHYGGRMWATSEEGKGSVFTFTLPYREIGEGRLGISL
jgi:signal transduction histidine kinase